MKKKPSKRKFNPKPKIQETVGHENSEPAQPIESSSLGKSGSNSNHPSWYNGNPLLTQSLGQINFASFKGAHNVLTLQRTIYDGVKYGRAEDSTYSAPRLFQMDNRFPGIMVHDFVPTFGSLNSTGNDAEEAARLIYANMRRAISGRRTYDASAVLQYILAVGSLQAAFGELHRALAAVRNRNLYNKYYGERLVEALGYSYMDLVGNYNQYVTLVNESANHARSLVLPTGMKLFDKWYQMSSSVYSDSEDSRSGLFAFIPRGFWKWGELRKSTTVTEDQIKAELRETGDEEVLNKLSVTTEVGQTDSQNYNLFAPFGLLFDFFPAAYTDNSDESTTRFQYIITNLKKTIFEYTDNVDFNIIAADLLKTYGEDVVNIQSFVPGAHLNITFDPYYSTSVKNIVYAPFEPVAIIEFPSIAWAKKANQRGLVYVVHATSVGTIPLDNAAVKRLPSESSTKYYSELISPQITYIYSHKEDLSGEEAMDILKWHIRYSVTSKKEGNVLLLKRGSDSTLDIATHVSFRIETMGTEIITASRIYGIIDHIYTARIDQDSTRELSDSLTPFGQKFYYYAISNFMFLPRYSLPDAEHNKVIKEYKSLVVPHDALMFATWANHWYASPALYYLMPNSIYQKLDDTSPSLLHDDDLVALNPWPIYSLMDTNTVKRHHDVALASLMGIGQWGSGTIDSERKTSGQTLSDQGLKA